MILKLDGFPNRKELKGSFGEWLAKWYIKFVSDTLVLHDVLIDGADGYTSQIDLLAIGSKGIYVVEVKMYNEGRIYGDGNQSQWYYYHYNKKYETYSPLKRNRSSAPIAKHLLFCAKENTESFTGVPIFRNVNTHQNEKTRGNTTCNLRHEQLNLKRENAGSAPLRQQSGGRRGGRQRDKAPRCR